MRTEFADLKSRADRLKEQLTALIDTLPDASPEVTALSKNAGTVMSSQLGNNWCPRYYLTGPTKTALKELVANSSGTDLLSRIDNVISSGKVHDIKIHPSIVQSIKALWGTP